MIAEGTSGKRSERTKGINVQRYTSGDSGRTVQARNCEVASAPSDGWANIGMARLSDETIALLLHHVNIQVHTEECQLIVGNWKRRFGLAGVG